MDEQRSEAVERVVARYLRGDTAPNMALMELVIASDSESQARAALEHSATPSDRESLRAVKDLWDKSPGLYDVLTRVIRSSEVKLAGLEQDRIRQLTGMFDEVAAISPSAGVALYSLGNDELLDEITREAVSLFRSWAIFDSSSVVVDLGCGSGRFVQALAPLVSAVVGVDISEAMLGHAACASGGLRNALLVRSTGRDLAFLRDGWFDAVLAIDSFPYLVQAGAAAHCVEECARILKPNGRLLVMNFAYGVDSEIQTRNVAELATRFGLAVSRNGTRDLKSWDGTAFLLQRQA